MEEGEGEVGEGEGPEGVMRVLVVVVVLENERDCSPSSLVFSGHPPPPHLAQPLPLDCSFHRLSPEPS